MTATLARPRTFAGVLKAAIAAGTTTDLSWGGALATLEDGRELRELLERVLVLPQLGIQRGPFATSFPVQTSRPQGYKVSQAEPKPATRFNLATVRLEPATIGTIIAVTKELAQSMEPGSDSAISRQLVSAVRSAANTALLDPNIAGSITNGITPLTSSGLSDEALFADLITLLSIGDEVRLVASLPWAVRVVAALRNAERLVRVVVAPEAENLIVAVDRTAVAAAWTDGVNVRVSEAATLQMRDDPQTGATEAVSMFQTDSMAVRVEMLANWARTRDEGVAVLEMAGS